MNENLCSFLLRAPKKFRHNNSSCLFQEFSDECEQACRGVHDREFEPTEASEISRPSVSDGSDNDDVCGRNATETLRLLNVSVAFRPQTSSLSEPSLTLGLEISLASVGSNSLS